jgi:hypothetical protein
VTLFYYEQFFRTALDGIDRSNIMPSTIQIGQIILLISFLVAVYESYIRGGDVRMLGIAGVKYVALGLVLSVYAVVFRDINGMFNAFSDFIANSTTSGDVFQAWLSDLREHWQTVGFQGAWDLLMGGIAAVVGVVPMLQSTFAGLPMRCLPLENAWIGESQTWYPVDTFAAERGETDSRIVARDHPPLSYCESSVYR